MQSRIAAALNLQTRPVVLSVQDEVPDHALRFKPGTWGCVMSLIASVATKGKTAAFGRETYGCWGGGVGLGFGNQYEKFPGGVDCFCGFLSEGNEKTPKGRAIGEAMKNGGGARMASDFLLGERYVRDSETTQRFVDSLPMIDVGDRFVIAQPLEAITQDGSNDLKSVTFFVEPDALSALVVLANHAHPERENVAMPWAAGCQVMGIYGYQELERPHPRALVGMTDLSARKTVRPSLGRHIMSFTAPWPKFLEMESHVEGSFFQRETWHALTTA